jgi:ubiquinone/menaquinone biosynthesis C-methylase UbiE
MDGTGFSVGVDIAKAQILYANEVYKLPTRQFLTITPGYIPFKDASFDRITVIEVIEHLSRKQGLTLLAEAYRTLEPGGLCIVSTPNYSGLWPFLEWILNRSGKISYKDQHISRFTASRLSGLMQEAGFDQVSIETFQGLAFAFAAVNWRLADIWESLPISLINFLILAKGMKKK